MNIGNVLDVPKEALEIMEQFYNKVLCAKHCRRLEIAKLLAEDKRSLEIAKILGMTDSNVRHQVNIMKEASGCNSLHGLTAYLSFVLLMKKVILLTVNGCRKNEIKAKFSH